MMSWTRGLLLLAGMALAIMVAIVRGALWAEEEFYVKVGVVFLLALLSLVCTDVAKLNPADSHTIGTLLSQYGLVNIARFLGGLAYWKLRTQCNDCEKYQRQLLDEILSANEECEYGKTHNFKSIHTREEFVKAHPLCDYSRYAPYVKRMSDGHKNVLFQSEVNFFSTSSGTTGKSKLFPCNTIASQKSTSTIMALFFCRVFEQDLKRTLTLRLWHPPRETSAGIPKGSKSLRMMSILKHELWIPVQRFIYHEAASYHVLALLALGEPQLGELSGVSSNLIYAFFKYIDHNADLLCDDLASGTLSNSLDVDDSIRKGVNEYLKPNENRAEIVRQELRKGKSGLALRLWPDLKTVVAACTGAYLHCARILEDTFTKGINLCNYGHFASEAVVGISMNGKKSGNVYTMTVPTAFMEFIPKEEIEMESPSTLFMEQLDIGKEYEVVLTTFSGLYRYRLGDLIKVVGKVGDTPTYEFQYRIGQCLNIAFERTPESILTAAVRHCQDHKWKQEGINVHDFMSTESTVLEPITASDYDVSHYVFFIECNAGVKLTEVHESQLDETLVNLYEPYRRFRTKGTIAHARIEQLKPGTCDSFKHKLWDGMQNVQFKIPRVLRREYLLKHLLENTC